MNERTVEQYLIRKTKEAGGLALKFVSPGTNGVPDRLVILPGGKIFFVELKAPGETARPLQIAQQNRLRKLGCHVYTDIDSAEKVKWVIRNETT